MPKPLIWGPSKGGGGAAAEVNVAVAPMPALPGATSGWQNFCIVARLSAGAIVHGATSWQVGITITSGTATVGNTVLARTAPHGTSIIDNTTITFGGVSNPTISAVGETRSDTITKTIDAAHDYYLVMFFSNVAGNAGLGLASNTGAGIAVGYDPSGDQTGAASTASYSTVSSTVWGWTSWIKIS